MSSVSPQRDGGMWGSHVVCIVSMSLWGSLDLLDLVVYTVCGGVDAL
ncbi:MAG: hypothetical protein QXQ57_04070 [Sulfolobales archaeon]